MKNFAEQQQILHSIWPKWRAIATSTNAHHPQVAEEAVQQLYALYKRPSPLIAWINSPRLIRGFLAERRPFFPHMRERLIYSIWSKLHNPEQLCARIGYDQQTGNFRLHANKAVVFSRTRLTLARNGRPPWLTSLGNVISQFDADVLALQALGKAMAIQIDTETQELTEITTTLAIECFAVILFENWCIMVKKPQTLVLNETQQLSAQNMPAFQACDLDLYVINGRVLSVNGPPNINIFNTLVSFPSRSTQNRLIAYLGWERFMELANDMGRVHELHRDKFGRLYRVNCGNQFFTVVRVKNSSPEPDGSFRHYVIPVDVQCRPLPDPMNPRQRLGRPQALTALNAVASTFYMTGADYAKMIGQQS